MAWPGSQSFAPTVRADGVEAVQPKSPRLENRRLLNLARDKPCLLKTPLCNFDSATTVACHANGVARGKGMGYKTSDFLSVWGCSDCNHYTDAYKGATRAQKEAAFMVGHSRQVIEWRFIAMDMRNPEADRKAAIWALEMLNATPIYETNEPAAL